MYIIQYTISQCFLNKTGADVFGDQNKPFSNCPHSGPYYIINQEENQKGSMTTNDNSQEKNISKDLN